MWGAWFFAQSAAPSSDTWVQSPWTTGGAVSLAFVVLGILFKRFLHREERWEDGWKKLLDAATEDAAHARQDAAVARLDAKAARNEAEEAYDARRMMQLELDVARGTIKVMQAELDELRRVVETMRGG